MLNETVSFCQNNPQSLVTDIRFILFHEDQGVIDAFKLESKALQEKFEGEKRSETVEVVQGDLTQESTDAIVNIIGPKLNMYEAGTLSQAVAKVSGIRLEDECAIQGITPGQHLAGTAIMTTGGNLPAQYIIHMVVGSSDRQHLQLCVEECVQLAETERLKTISLPAVGTGVGSLSDLDSARMTFQALSNVLGSCVYLRHVRIVLNQAELMKPFLCELKFSKWQENKQLHSYCSPVKSNEPPRKKPRVNQCGEILLFPTADRRFDREVKCPTGRASFWVKFPTVRSLTRVKYMFTTIYNAEKCLFEAECRMKLKKKQVFKLNIGSIVIFF